MTMRNHVPGNVIQVREAARLQRRFTFQVGDIAAGSGSSA